MTMSREEVAARLGMTVADVAHVEELAIRNLALRAMARGIDPAALFDALFAGESAGMGKTEAA